MRSHEVTTVQPLLNDDGSLREPGWSRKLIQVYDRKKIKAGRLRIKEWDYYIIIGKDFGLGLTLSDNAYIGLQSVTLFDFNKPWEHTETILKPFPLGKLKLPSDSSTGDTVYRDKRLFLEFRPSPGKRTLSGEFKKFHNGKTLSFNVTLAQPEMDTMVIATPWKEKKTAFYYNQKINCMRADGSITFDGKKYTFNPKTDFGTLDWGRGVWTYNNKWYWGSGNGIVNGKPFGFNIGYGFGDTAAATENIIHYNGKGHKIDDITFNIPGDSYLKPWSFASSDGRFEMDFIPVIDRAAKIDLKFLLTDQHQVFGRMTGKAVLDDGKVLNVNDLLCFAEYVHNKY
jgi:hypothetical protein